MSSAMPLTALSLEVPEGAAPGTVLQVSVGGGRVVSLQVPEGAAPGTTLQFQVELGEDEEDGPTYTSGEDDESGPAILSPTQFRARHPEPSPHRARTRPYRTHYFHNQKDGDLYRDPHLEEVMSSPVPGRLGVARLRYPEAVATPGGFDAFCTGGAGTPVILTDVPHATETMSRFSASSLRAVDSLAANARVRVCQAFQWGKKEIDGRLPLQTYFRLIEEHPNADVPFYVFENDIGGRRHTRASYERVDAWNYGNAAAAAAVAVAESDEQSEGRAQFSQLYAIPTLFSECMLKVPYLLRPRSTDGVLLVGCRRSGSYPHVDPTYTAAWNWLLDGVKRWCMFPPHVPREVICGKDAADVGNNRESDAASSIEAQLTGNGVGYWWREQFPKLRARADELGMVEVLQQPGEIIYVPQGWWHAVINVSEWTVAVTHNLVMPRALPDAFKMAVADDAVFARRWWRCLCKFAPEAARALKGATPAAVAACLGVTLPVGEYNGMQGNATVTRIDTELTDEATPAPSYTLTQLAQASALAESMSKMLGGMAVSAERCAHVLNARAEWSDNKAITVLLSMMDAGDDLGTWAAGAIEESSRLLTSLPQKVLDAIISHSSMLDVVWLACCSKTLSKQASTWHVPETLTLRLSGGAEGEGSMFARLWARLVSTKGGAASGCKAVQLTSTSSKAPQPSSAGRVLRAVLGDDMRSIGGLRSLDLSGCAFGDADAQWLATVLSTPHGSACREVSLMDCGGEFTDVGFEALVTGLLLSPAQNAPETMTRLEISFCADGAITEKGVVAAFEKLDRLRRRRSPMDGEASIGVGDNEEGDVTLNLSGNGSAITDSAVRAVAKALGARLRGITLFESPSLSDVALDTLSTCSGLQRVNVMYCGGVGPAAVARLRERLPLMAEVLG